MRYDTLFWLHLFQLWWVLHSSACLWLQRWVTTSCEVWLCLFCREQGFKGLYKGLEAKLLQTVATAALMFVAYEKIAAFIFSLLRRTSRWTMRTWIWNNGHWLHSELSEAFSTRYFLKSVPFFSFGVFRSHSHGVFGHLKRRILNPVPEEELFGRTKAEDFGYDGVIIDLVYFNLVHVS